MKISFSPKNSDTLVRLSASLKLLMENLPAQDLPPFVRIFCVASYRRETGKGLQAIFSLRHSKNFNHENKRANHNLKSGLAWLLDGTSSMMQLRCLSCFLAAAKFYLQFIYRLSFCMVCIAGLKYTFVGWLTTQYTIFSRLLHSSPSVFYVMHIPPPRG